MNQGGPAELAVFERIAQLHREAERERLAVSCYRSVVDRRLRRTVPSRWGSAIEAIRAVLARPTPGSSRQAALGPGRGSIG